MRIPIAATIIFSSLALAGAQGTRGVVSSVTVERDVSVGVYRFIVRGTNPCGAVRLNYGDGVFITHAIRDLPHSVTHEYTATGEFTVLAEGMGNCDGSARARVRVTAVRPQPQAAQRQPATIRFAAMDTNNDGVITRAEWRGSARSFTVHDWNGDGRLSGDEVRIGASPAPAGGRGQQQADINDWTEARFRQLDRNGDNRLSRSEWRYDLEEFIRVDRNGDNVLTMNEYLRGDIDDDREDRFNDLDLNRNSRIERSEWHGSLEAFEWLDRNGDGVLSRAEVAGPAAGQVDPVERGARTGREATATVNVSSRVQWTDTGLTVRAGDPISIRATGTIQFSGSRGDIAEPDGARGRQATRNAPMPQTEIGALVARIGTSEPFFVGAVADRVNAPQGGRLYLGVNDDVLNDNRGEFRVTITTDPADRGAGSGRDATAAVTVSSRVQWTDTGLTVRAGDAISIRATGTIQFTPSTADRAEPDGARGRPPTHNAPMPQNDVGALVARIGTSAPFFVGAAADRLSAPQGGRLFLGVNDDVLTDNRGDFRVTVTVGPRGGGGGRGGR